MKESGVRETAGSGMGCGHDSARGSALSRRDDRPVVVGYQQCQSPSRYVASWRLRCGEAKKLRAKVTRLFVCGENDGSCSKVWRLKPLLKDKI